MSDNKIEKKIFGHHSVIEAIKNKLPLQKIYLQSGYNKLNLLELLSSSNIPFSFVPEKKLSSLVKENHKGIVAILSSIDFFELEEIFKPDKKQVFLIMDGITDVRNFGAIIRSACGLGANGIIVAQSGSAPLNEVAIQASAGSAFNIPLIRVPHIKDSIYFFKANKVCVMACTEKAKNSVKSIDFNKSLAIVLGNENKGISSGVLNLCDDKFKIPISESLDSYNVSVAAALVLYEYFRQNN